MVQRLFAARRRLPPGAFLCGLRSDDPAMRGVSRVWRYAVSWIDGDRLVYGRKRLSLRLEDPTPREDGTVRDGFLVWAARDETTGACCDIAVGARDAYKLLQSPLANSPR